MKTLSALFLCALIVLTGCNKDSDEQNSPTEVASTILLSSIAGGNSLLSAYNLDGSTKWKRNDMGGTSGMNPIYYKGVIYLSVTHTGPGYDPVQTGKFYAIDATTGQDKWKIDHTPNIIYDWTVRNDTLFCGEYSNDRGYLVAYNAKTGAVLYQYQNPHNAPPIYLNLDGNTLYFIDHSGFVAYVVAFDLSTKTIKWKKPTTVNIYYGPSKLIISNNAVYVTNGVGNLMAFDKSTGNSMWTNEDPSGSNRFGQPSLSNNLIIAKSEYKGLHAFDKQTGATVWNWDKNRTVYIYNDPFLDRGNVYFSVSDTAGYFLAKHRASDGNRLWAIKTPQTYESLVVTGNNLLTIKRSYPNSSLPSKIMIFDSNSGTLKDSIAIEGINFGNLGIITTSGNYLLANY